MAKVVIVLEENFKNKTVECKIEPSAARIQAILDSREATMLHEYAKAAINAILACNVKAAKAEDDTSIIKKASSLLLP